MAINTPLSQSTASGAVKADMEHYLSLNKQSLTHNSESLCLLEPAKLLAARTCVAVGSGAGPGSPFAAGFLWCTAVGRADGLAPPPSEAASLIPFCAHPTSNIGKQNKNGD